MSYTVQNVTIEGRVKWFNPKKGFGFIMGPDKEYFFHHTEIQMQGYRTVPEGQRVTFRASLVDGKDRATQVTPLVSSEGARPYEDNSH